MRRTVTAVAAAAALALLLAGCAATTAPSASSPAPTASPIATPRNRVVLPEDADAFRQLERVAPTALKLEGGTVSAVRCWTPSEHLFDDPSIAPAGTWKVLCRVFYDLRGVDRYQDATCIGDFDATPMLDHCYVWEYYTGEPKFDDGRALASPAPTPAA